jgi:hypothetical protein
MDDLNFSERPDSELINLFSQISIPREILDRYQGLTIADLSRLNNTSSDRREFELTLTLIRVALIMMGIGQI